MKFLIIFIFVMSLLDIIKEAFSVVKCIVIAEQYTITNTRLIILWASIAFALTSIITQFSI